MEETQEARALLRKKFLTFITNCLGRKVLIKMIEGEKDLEGRLEAFHVDSSLILVSQLETPLGRQESAKIRVSDIVSLSIKL